MKKLIRVVLVIAFSVVAGTTTADKASEPVNQLISATDQSCEMLK